MRFGVCSSDIDLAKRAGYDYIELGLASVAAMDGEAFASLAARLAASGLKAEAFNMFLPGIVRLTGPCRDIPAALEYVRRALPKAKALGGEIVVFGSSGARNIPEGYPPEQGFDELAGFLRGVGPIAADNGISIAIEPLRPAESNIINHVSEGARLARAAAHPSIFTLADFYHVAEGGESMESVSTARGILAHCHIAAPGSRAFMHEGDGFAGVYQLWGDTLRAMGYDGRISVEGRADKPEADYADALATLKRYFQAHLAE